MPITIPIPDAAWRARLVGQVSKGRDWPELRHATGPRARARVQRLWLGAAIWVLALFASFSAAGWLTAFVVVVLNVAGYAWCLWLLYRHGEALVFAGYVRARARRAAGAAPRATTTAATS